MGKARRGKKFYVHKGLSYVLIDDEIVKKNLPKGHALYVCVDDYKLPFEKKRAMVVKI